MKNLSAILTLLFCFQAIAQESININNPGFEVDSLGESQFTPSASLWEITQSAGVWNPTASNILDEASRGNIAYSGGGNFRQTLSETVTENTTYTLTIDVGLRLDHTTPNDWIVSLRAGGQVLGQTAGNTGTITPGTWETATVIVTTDHNDPIGSNLEIYFEGEATQVLFDDVALTKEPSGTFSPWITSDVTLHVPADYADLHEALEALSTSHIKKGVVATIQVADGTYTYNEEIVFSHPSGKQIHIIGNPTTPSNVVLDFSAAMNGISVFDGDHLGLLQGFRLTGASNTQGIGLFADQNAGMIVEDVEITLFERGVSSAKNSSITLEDTTVTDTTSGLHAIENGSIVTTGYSGSTNTYAAFAHVNGFIRLVDPNITSNAYGVRAVNGSYVDVEGSGSISSNTTFGFEAQILSSIRVRTNNLQIQGNANNYHASGNSFIQLQSQ